MICGGREGTYIYMQISVRKKFKFEVAAVFCLE